MFFDVHIPYYNKQFQNRCYILPTFLSPLLVRSSLGPEIRKYTVPWENMPLEKFYELKFFICKFFCDFIIVIVTERLHLLFRDYNNSFSLIEFFLLSLVSVLAH